MSRFAALLRLGALLSVLALAATACGASGDADASDDAGESTTASPTTTAVPATSAPETTAGMPLDSALVAADGDVVNVHYIGTLDSGEEFDSSRDRGQTLSFTVGSGQMISGFDRAVVGMGIGETKTVRLDPADAYGEPRDDLIFDVPTEALPEGTAVGDTLVSSNGGRVIVLAIGEESSTVDANHNLAGQYLTFEIEMVSIDR